MALIKTSTSLELFTSPYACLIFIHCPTADLEIGESMEILEGDLLHNWVSMWSAIRVFS